jgi:hypothetical protein
MVNWPYVEHVTISGMVKWPYVEHVTISGMVNCLHYCLAFMLRNLQMWPRAA